MVAAGLGLPHNTSADIKAPGHDQEHLHKVGQWKVFYVHVFQTFSISHPAGTMGGGGGFSKDNLLGETVHPNIIPLHRSLENLVHTRARDAVAGGGIKEALISWSVVWSCHMDGVIVPEFRKEPTCLTSSKCQKTLKVALTFSWQAHPKKKWYTVILFSFFYEYCN